MVILVLAGKKMQYGDVLQVKRSVIGRAYPRFIQHQFKVRVQGIEELRPDWCRPRAADGEGLVLPESTDHVQVDHIGYLVQVQCGVLGKII